MVRNARKWLSAVLAVAMLISMVGTVFAEEAAPPATNVLYTDVFKVNGATLTKDTPVYYGGLSANQTTYALTVEKHVDNSVYVYENENGEKGEKIATVGRESQSGVVNLTLEKNLNDFIITLESKDGTVTADYDLRVEKGMVLVTGNSLTVTEAEDGTMSYIIPYTERNVSFKVNLQNRNYNVINKNTGAVMTPDGAGNYDLVYYTPGETEISIEFPSSDPAVEPTYYNFVIGRAKNHLAELEKLEAFGCTVTKEDETVYSVTVPKDLTEVELLMTFSAEATPHLFHSNTGVSVAPNGTVYAVSYTTNDDAVYNLDVTAQNGNYKGYTIVLTRVKNTDCELLDIESAQPVDGGYEVNISAKAFYVNVVASPYATYKIYADAACTREIINPFLQLQAAKTEVYIVVVAEDGVTKSAPVKLTVNTTATDFDAVEEGPVYQTMTNLGKVAVTGGLFLADPSENFYNGRGQIRVSGTALGEKMYFRIAALNDYEPKGVRLYADVNKTILLNNALYITPDSACTNLYAVLERNGVKEEYIVQIISDVSYTFTDKPTDWAEKYVEAIGKAGLMKGYEDNTFRGTNNLDRNEMAALMVRLAGANKDLYAEVAYIFTDTTEEWALNYVKAATRIGLIDGIPVTNADGEVEGYTYNGGDYSTRSEFLKVFGNVMFIHEDQDVEAFYAANQQEIDELVNKAEFKDIEEVEEWAKPFVYTAYYMGWIEGSSHPDGLYLEAGDNITREQVAAVIMREVGMPGEA